MKKTNAIVILLLITINCGYTDDVSVNHFIWPDDNKININEYNVIIGDYGTFYTGIVDKKPKLSVYCIKGLKNDGTEVLFENRPITIDITYPLSIEQTSRLRLNFRRDFLKDGFINFFIDNGLLSIIAENTGENLNDYITNLFAD